MDLKVNRELDVEFMQIDNIINAIPTPNNFGNVYDYAKRYINKHGISAIAIEKIYKLGLCGYIVNE